MISGTKSGASGDSGLWASSCRLAGTNAAAYGERGGETGEFGEIGESSRSMSVTATMLEVV